MSDKKDNIRLLVLPEPHRTILEASIDALMRSNTHATIELQKIQTLTGQTFSVKLKTK
jgi:hypothetical protein